MSLFPKSLGSRLLLGGLLPLMLFASAALVAYFTIQRLLSALESEQRVTRLLAEGYRLTEGIAGMAADKNTHHLLGDAEFRARFDQRFAAAEEALRSLRSLTGSDPVRVEELVAVADLLQKWRALADQDFQLFNGEGLRAALARLQLRAAAALHADIRARVDRLVEEEQQRLRAAQAEVQHMTRESVWAITVSSLLAVALSLLSTRLLTAGITRPIHALRRAAARLHKGQFQVVTPSGPGEIAELARSFNLMGLAMTEREALLQSSEHRYRAVVGSISTLLWTADAQGRVTDLSRWCAFTGQEEAGLGEGGWLDAVHPDDREALRRAWADTVAGRDPPEQEARVRRADGAYRHFRCRGVAVRDAQGQVLEWVNVCADVTERKREEELLKEKEAAEAASRAKSDFLAKMSHELRTPLNAVIGMAKMLSTRRFGPLTDKQADYVEDITGAGEHLLRLINDILDLSKVEAGRMELAPQPVYVGAAAAEAVSAMRALAEAKGLRLTCTGPDPDGLVVTDPARLRQVLFNLVSNAVKFTHRGGVQVRCAWADGPTAEGRSAARAEASAVRFEVEDTGVGIDAADQAKVGREFYQGRSGPAQAVDGTGLGLALTRRLVELMGGDFWFTSEPGHGSTFGFSLPLRVPLPLVPYDSEGPPAPGRPTVLVIEDHPPTRKLLSDWLDGAGVAVAQAADGGEGLEQARRRRPALILLDIRLPRVSGWQVLTQLKQDPETAGIPVVVVSALEGNAVPSELDVLDWFVKPLDREHFLGRLRGACPGLFGDGRRLTALVVDDDTPGRTLLADLLRAEGIDLIEAASGREAIELLPRCTADLVLLGLLMPDRDGFEVVEALRADPKWEGVPVLVVTAKDITATDLRRLGGHIRAVLRKGQLTQQRLAERLADLGLRPGP